MKYQRAELEKVYLELEKKQRPLLALFGAFIGLIVAFTVTAVMERYFILNVIVAMLIAPAIVGYFARFIGGLYQTFPRLIVALFSGVTYASIFILGKQPTAALIISPVVMAIVFFTSMRKLSLIEEFAAIEHAAEPFQSANSNRNKHFTSLVIVLSLPVVGYFILNHYGNRCLTSIENGEHHVIVEYCFSPDISSLEEVMLKKDYELTEHWFGRYELFTSEASLMKFLASEGDAKYEEYWWVILHFIYQNSSTDLQEERAIWQQKLLDKEYAPAIKMHLEEIIRPSLITDKTKKEAIEYIKILTRNRDEDADAFSLTVKHKITTEELQNLLQYQMGNLDSLTLPQLEILVRSFDSGEFYTLASELREENEIEEYYTDSIFIETSQKDLINVLEVMAKKYKHTEAYFRLANIYMETDITKAQEYLIIAAQQKHPAAAFILGLGRYCINDRKAGLEWLNKATAYGSKRADEYKSRILGGEERAETCSVLKNLK
ncbi:hypothetical protein MHM98_15015 [Psychrobium sp. MM17-31]|uniref:hypothetical protein n=1 Tax=Psychrobium sp. MM17-31 TaxID=2917758 RepID=UPI001EF3F937|nr:hypothetical protein [Psychrobium sp. MM17-31]MCG7532643.1 hypothetical protein [Psychrobium sp. MM17-31]